MKAAVILCGSGFKDGSEIRESVGVLWALSQEGVEASCFALDEDAENTEAVPSPCISVCRMSPDRSHCEGCFRSLDEIRIWSRADSHLRRGIWRQLLDRAGIAVPVQPESAEG